MKKKKNLGVHLSKRNAEPRPSLARQTVSPARTGSVRTSPCRLLAIYPTELSLFMADASGRRLDACLAAPDRRDPSALLIPHRWRRRSTRAGASTSVPVRVRNSKTPLSGLSPSSTAPELIGNSSLADTSRYHAFRRRRSLGARHILKRTAPLASAEYHN